MNKKIFTIGTSDRSQVDFLDILSRHEISLVVDVRSKNGSRVLHFDESRFKNLSKMLMNNSITYDQSLHLSLGGLQGGKMTLGNFFEYAKTPEFKKALSLLKEKILKNCQGTVILCCERDPKQCHRRIIASALKIGGYEVIHL
jgi:uncharacterized protein (DUF488 family)